jgi:hypothetical protein
MIVPSGGVHIMNGSEDWQMQFSQGEKSHNRLMLKTYVLFGRGWLPMRSAAFNIWTARTRSPATHPDFAQRLANSGKASYLLATIRLVQDSSPGVAMMHRLTRRDPSSWCLP